MKILMHIAGCVLFYVGFFGACAGVIPFGMMDPGLLWIQIYGTTAFVGSIALFVVAASVAATVNYFKTP